MATMRITYRHEHSCSRLEDVHVVEVPVDEETGVFMFAHPHCAERATVFGDWSELRLVKMEEIQ